MRKEPLPIILFGEYKILNHITRGMMTRHTNLSFEKKNHDIHPAMRVDLLLTLSEPRWRVTSTCPPKKTRIDEAS